MIGEDARDAAPEGADDPEEPMASRKAKNAHLTEPTWGVSDEDGPPVTELASEMAGSLSPFGEDHSFPLPVEQLRYAHPTDRPNMSGVQAPGE